MLNTLKHLWIDAKLTYHVVVEYIFKTNRLYLAAALFVGVLFTLQWLFNIDQLIEIILGDNPLSVFDRIDFMLDGFINIFRFANDFVPIAMILIAFLQSLALTLLLTNKASKKDRAKQALPLSLSILGVGCVACGGSILTPLLGLIVSSVSVAFAESLSRVLLLVAIILSYNALTKISFIVANKQARRKHAK